MAVGQVAAVPVTPAISLVVLNPDGTPAVDAVAVARVNEYHRGRNGIVSVPIYTSSADASGVVAVNVPTTDPYIASHFPAQKLFNVHVNIFTFRDLTTRRPKAYHAVNYVLNLGDPAVAADPAGVDGMVVQLVTVPDRPAAPVRDPLPDFDTCEYPPPSGASACMAISHPYDIQGEKVVLAHNVGQGIDMTTTFQLTATARTATTTVAGVDGLFVEARGEHTLSTSVTDAYWFRGSGINSANEDAAVTVNFAEVYVRECWATGCSETWDYPPDAVTGQTPMLPSDEAPVHDQARDPSITNVDCISYVVQQWTNSTGANKNESWTFGFDFQGQFKVFTLHASALTKSTDSQGSSTAYTWRISGSQRPHHHVYVRNGHIPGEADAGSLCPYNSPGSTYTHAAWRDMSNPARPPYITMPPETPAAVKDGAEEGRRRTDRCHEEPERCYGP